MAVAPSYRLRLVGMLLACASLAFFWHRTARALLATDGMTMGDALAELRDGSTPPLLDMRAVLRGVWTYAHPDFHPDQVDHRPLIERTLARLRAEAVV